MRTGLFALAALLTLSPAVRAQDEPLRHWTIGDAEVSVEDVVLGDNHDLLTIRVGGNLMYAATAVHIYFITSEKGEADTPKLVPVTSAKAHDLVIESYSGGINCCFSITIVTIGEDNVVSTAVKTNDGLTALFRLPGKARYGLRTSDYSYYRWTGEAGAPHPKLLLRYDIEKGGATVAGDLMKEPAPSAKHLAEMEAKMRADPLWKAAGLSNDYLQVVLDLVYSGNLQAAQDYAMKAWPDDVPGRQSFIDDLNQCALPLSPWWPDIAALNGIQPYKAGKDCNS
jgi:hypothetical protein